MSEDLLKDLEVKVIARTSWNEVLDLARATVHKDALDKMPSDKFKHGILNAEHSPIRALSFRVELKNVPYFVAMHLRTHKYGIEHFISTQRSDRTGEDRNAKRQDAPVNHIMILNAQEMMFVSRRRLCGLADKTTRKVWQEVVNKLREVDSVLASHCVPMCVYRGGCPEPISCKNQN